jgi:hypothetical protein
MRINIETGEFGPYEPARVGNVYPVRGGRGLRDGNMMILIATTNPKDTWQGSSGLMLIINKQGEPTGVSSYGMGRVEELQPIAFVDGIEDLVLTMRSL